MNPLNLVTSAVTHPVRTVGSVVALGAQTTAQVIEWAAGRARDLSRVRESVSAPPAPAPVVDTQVREEAEETAPAVRVPAKKAPTRKTPAKNTAAKKAPAKKAPAKKAPAKKAPSARAATLGPALDPDALESLEDAEAQQSDEPLLDPAVAKSVRSEAEVLSRAADPDKG